MKYMGSKSRHAKEIIPILMQEYEQGMHYIEPFVGGANIIDKIPIPNHLKFAFDVHEYLIAMWEAVSRGWDAPEFFTEEDYRQVKETMCEKDPITAYAGFALSYGGKWFGGWCRDKLGKRDYVGEAWRNAKKQFPLLRGVNFRHSSVFDIEVLGGKSLIYCDPPYKGATKYRDDFNHEKFYEWCRQKKREGHIIFVSEYSMPEDFECVWSKRVNSSLTKDTGGKKNVERLFKL